MRGCGEMVINPLLDTHFHVDIAFCNGWLLWFCLQYSI